MSNRPLSPPIVARLLQSAVTILRAELEAMPVALATFHPAPGEWCAREVLGHLIEAERRGFAGRISIILAADHPQLEAWDQAEVAKARRDCERDTKALLDEFTAMRQESVALAAGLRDVDLARTGRHPKVGMLCVADVLQEWVHHDRNHIRQILANVQSRVWPDMGKTQKFSLA
jgi:hypothetical protein